MPRRFVAKEQIIREDLGDGDWVDVRSGLSWGGLMDIYDESGSGVGRSKRALIAVLRAGVAGWGGPGFTNEDGTPVELNDEALVTLDPETAMDLGQLVDKHNAEMALPGKRRGSAGSSSSSPAAASSATTSGASS